MKHIEKYLKTYAEKEIQLLQSFPKHFSFSNCVVIPACNEESGFINRLSNSDFCSNTLLILVVNQAPKAPSEITKANQTLASHVYANNLIWLNEYLAFYDCNNLHVLIVNRFHPGLEIPEKEGVGRARKIGCDLAVALFKRGCLRTLWIFSSDADARLPDNYFNHINDRAIAQVFDFVHVGDSGPLLTATLTYEKAIKYYQSALAWAGSPYAFYTLGSTLAVEVSAYCKVRGFPPRAGGEDFYLLNKLAKIGSVHYEPQVQIKLESRLSERVPFGTGPAVKKILDAQENGKVYTYYNPDIFKELKFLLTNLPAIWQHANNAIPLEETFSSQCVDALKALKFDRFISHCKSQNITENQFSREFHTWFDALQTFKFVHNLQNTGYHAIELDACINSLEKF